MLPAYQALAFGLLADGKISASFAACCTAVSFLFAFAVTPDDLSRLTISRFNRLLGWGQRAALVDALLDVPLVALLYVLPKEAT